MGYFNRDTNNRPGRDNRGGGRGFGGGGRSDGPREMFKTVCSNCGNECEVPFKPTNGKPVYCSACFEKMGPRTDERRPERNDRFERPRFDRPERSERPQAPRDDSSRMQLDALNAKLDKIIALLSPKAETASVKVVKSEPKAKEEVKAEAVEVKEVEVKEVKTPKVKKTSKK